MPTLDQLMQRTKIVNGHKATVSEIVRLGFRGPLDPDEAERAIATGQLDDETEAEVVAEYQAYWKPNLDDLARRTYGREAKVDGVIGQVTLDSVLNRTCGVPDRFYAADGTLKKAEANWPTSCRMDVGFYIDVAKYQSYASAMGLTAAQFKSVFVRALDHIKSFAKIGFHVTEDRAAARMYVGFDRLGGSTLAWSHLANNDCGDKEQRYTVRTWAEDYLFLVIVHECLHAAGCPHDPGNTVMNPSIVPSLTGMTPRDVANLLSKGYEKADPKPPEDPDDPDPDPDKWPIGWAASITTKDGQVLTAADIAKLRVRFNDGKNRSLIEVGG